MKEITYQKPETKGIIPMKKNENYVEPVQTFDNQDVLKSLEDSILYNENITNHLPCYLETKPIQNVLIRIYRRLPIVTKSGLIVDMPSQADWAKVIKQVGSGQEMALNELPTEFKFTREAVIVALPEYLKDKLQVNQKVAINQIEVKSYKTNDGVVYFNYMFSWTHPSASKIAAIDDCTDPHYGYALVPYSFIEAMI